MRSYRYQRRLYWSECDAAGIIFFPHYARWMVDGLDDFFRALGVEIGGDLGEGRTRGLPSVGLTLKFLSAPRLNQMVTHEISVVRIGQSSMTFAHRFVDGERVLAEGEETRIWAVHAAGSETPIVPERVPGPVRALLEASD